MKMRCVFALSLLAVSGSAMGNLIVNGDFQSGVLAPSTSMFSFQSTNGSASLPVDSINDEGTYSIVTFDTIHESWVDFNDHTFGDQRGQYMIVNGSDAGGGPAWAQTVAVLSNTQYDLSGWFASLFPAAVAALEWRIIGDQTTVVSPAFNAPADLPGGPGLGVWEQRSYQFDSGANTSISIEIWDTSGIAQGNDYAVDDLSLTVVPAPASMALIGLGGLAAIRRRR